MAYHQHIGCKLHGPGNNFHQSFQEFQVRGTEIPYSLHVFLLAKSLSVNQSHPSEGRFEPAEYGVALHVFLLAECFSVTRAFKNS